MKNLKLLLLLLPLVISCTVDSTSEEGFEQNLNLEFNVSESTALLTQGFIDKGVSYVEVNKTNSSINYSFKTYKVFQILNKVVDYSNYDFTLKGNTFSFSNSKNYSIFLKEEDLFINTPNYHGLLSNYAQHNNFDLPSVILIFAYEELSATEDKKIDFNKYAKEASNSRVFCSFWNTYYVYGLGATEGVANSNLASEIVYYTNNGDLNGCTALGGSSTSCAFSGGLGCVAVQGYCCQDNAPAVDEIAPF